MLNDGEIKVIELLSEAWNNFLKLEHQHPCDKEQFCNALHICQHLIMIRDVRRQNPEIFPCYDENGNEIKNVKIQLTEQQLLQALVSGKPIELEGSIEKDQTNE